MAKKLTWYKDQLCHSETHSYTIYEDAREGWSVSWHNLTNDTADKRHGFGDLKDAQDWIEKTHHKAAIEKYREYYQ